MSEKSSNSNFTSLRVHCIYRIEHHIFLHGKLISHIHVFTYIVGGKQKIFDWFKTILVELLLRLSILRKCQWIQSSATYVWNNNRFHRVCYLRKEHQPHISKLRFYWSTLPQPPNRERESTGAAVFEIQQTLHINSDVKAGRRWRIEREGKRGEFERANRGWMSLEESSLKFF